MIDEVPTRHRDIHRQARPFVALPFAAHLDQHRRAGRRPTLDPGAILAAQEAGAAHADVHERSIEVGHHPFEPAEEYRVDRRGPVAPRDLQFGQAPARRQRHQEGLRRRLDNQNGRAGSWRHRPQQGRRLEQRQPDHIAVRAGQEGDEGSG